MTNNAKPVQLTRTSRIRRDRNKPPRDAQRDFADGNGLTACITVFVDGTVMFESDFGRTFCGVKDGHTFHRNVTRRTTTRPTTDWFADQVNMMVNDLVDEVAAAA